MYILCVHDSYISYNIMINVFLPRWVLRKHMTSSVIWARWLRFSSKHLTFQLLKHLGIPTTRVTQGVKPAVMDVFFPKLVKSWGIGSTCVLLASFFTSLSLLASWTAKWFGPGSQPWFLPKGKWHVWPSRCFSMVSKKGSMEMVYWVVKLQIFHSFHPVFGEDDPIWLIFFRWVETSN